MGKINAMTRETTDTGTLSKVSLDGEEDKIDLLGKGNNEPICTVSSTIPLQTASVKTWTIYQQSVCLIMEAITLGHSTTLPHKVSIRSSNQNTLGKTPPPPKYFSETFAPAAYSCARHLMQSQPSPCCVPLYQERGMNLCHPLVILEQRVPRSLICRCWWASSMGAQPQAMGFESTFYPVMRVWGSVGELIAASPCVDRLDPMVSPFTCWVQWKLPSSLPVWLQPLLSPEVSLC